MRFTTIISIILINIKIFFLKIFNPKKIIPYKILINLTDLCNSRCNFCDIWKIKPKNEINHKDITQTLKNYEQDLIWLSLSGGEVTLVNYFYELIDYLKANFPKLKIIAFTTNALAPNKTIKYAEYIKMNGFDPLITISLDGDEKTHDEIRGVNGNYKKCMYVFEQLKRKNIMCHFGITVSDQNYSFIKNKFKYFSDKIKAITFVHSDGIYKKTNDVENSLMLDGLKIIYKNFKIKKVYEIIEKIHIKISILFLQKFKKKNIIPCDVLNTSLHIMANGDVKPCMFMDKVGNIKDNNLKEILANDKVRISKDLIKNNNCPKCWMNCYSPHSIMQHPFKSIMKLLS